MDAKRRLIRVDCKAAALLDKVKDLCLEVEQLTAETFGDDAKPDDERILKALAEIFPYASEVYEDCGGDEETRGRAPRMREVIKNAKAILNEYFGGWPDE